MKSNGCKFPSQIHIAIAGIVIIRPLSPVLAEEFCAGLNRGIQSTTDQFRSLRKEFNTRFGEYKADIEFGDISDCVTYGDKANATLTCSKDYDSDGAAASDKFRRTVEAVGNCLGSEVNIMSKADKYVSFNYKPTDDDITVRLIEAKRQPPTKFDVSVEISYVDPVR